MSLFISLYRKSIYKGVHNLIHFNLSLSLMIGLILFVSSVETLKDHEVLFVFDTTSQLIFLCIYYYLGWLYNSCCPFTLFLLGGICMDAM